MKCIKNARGYVQDSFNHYKKLKLFRRSARKVEKDFNRARIEQSLYAVEQAIQRCEYTVHILERLKTSHQLMGSFSNGILHNYCRYD